MRRLVLLAIVMAEISGMQTISGQANLGPYGTYSNLARSKQSDDLNGYEITLVAQSDSAYAVFECAQGAPSKAVFVPVQMQGRRISFRVDDQDNACNGEYTGVLAGGGLRLHSAVVGDTQFVPRRASFWVSTMPAPTKYEQVFDPLFDRLAEACPAKKLEEMAPADLDLQIENFAPSLSAAQKRRFEALAKVGCKDSFAGVGCGNAAFLKTAAREGYLGRFVRALCAADLVCMGPVRLWAGKEFVSGTRPSPRR